MPAVQWLIRQYLYLLMPLAMMTSLGLDGWAAYNIAPKVYRYSTMREVSFSAMAVDFLTHFYALHLRTYIMNQGTYKYWDTQHRIDPREQRSKWIPDEEETIFFAL